ncbi:MAG: S-methyl-5-thioribose-1-phosphate isomerase [Vampirovibrionales bacterium]
MTTLLDASSTSHTTPLNKELFPVVLQEDGVRLIDQTVLPTTLTHVVIKTPQAMEAAIRTMIVRGAPAIGIAAAYGLVLSLRLAVKQHASLEATTTQFYADAALLRASRPTAVNLMWAIDRMLACFEAQQSQRATLETLLERLTHEAEAIHHEDLEACLAMGRYGASLLKPNARLQTHCNAGALATAGHGTALGIIREAYHQGKCSMVYADETRPRNQGGKLTTWELLQDKIPVTLVCDNMAATLHSKGMVDAVIVGADRITANGDVANKIGTFTLALVAKAHDVPFYVAAPSSTFDLTLPTGNLIPIEERCGSEITHATPDVAIAPATVPTFNPGFDVTPNHLITAIITEKGIALPPFEASLPALLKADV